MRERRATMTAGADGSRPIEYGFLPTGALEDVQDYWYWLATNAATVWGFEALAAALADFGHPRGEDLVREAEAFRDDFTAGITESRIRSPVVRLRDGTYVPKIPSHLHERGRAHGWIRETLEGAIFLPTYELLPPARRRDEMDSSRLRRQPLHFLELRLRDPQFRPVLVLSRRVQHAGEPARQPDPVPQARRDQALCPHVLQCVHLRVLS